jgi:hypothetical protein
MTQRVSIILLFSGALLLAACVQNTALRFSNKTECGTAAITLTNMETGNASEHTGDEGKTIEIEVEPNVEYRYEVTYPRLEDLMQCDPKTVTTMLDKGKTLNITLDSVRDPALQPTAMPGLDTQ